MDLGVGINDGVDVGRLNNIDDQKCWFDEEVPEVGDRDEVGFEHLDCMFCVVSTMVTQESNLNVEFFIPDGVNEVSGDFIVKTDEGGSKFTIIEFLVSLFECTDVLFGFAGADGFGCDVIGIVVVNNKHIFVAADRGYWLVFGGIHGDDILYFIFTKDKNIAVMDFTAWFGILGGLWLGAADVFVDHLEMTKGRFLFLCAVLADAFGGETGPAGKIAVVGSFNPIGNG